MQINDAKQRAVLALELGPLFERADIIADVELARRLDAGEKKVGHKYVVWFRPGAKGNCTPGIVDGKPDPVLH